MEKLALTDSLAPTHLHRIFISLLAFTLGVTLALNLDFTPAPFTSLLRPPTFSRSRNRLISLKAHVSLPDEKLPCFPTGVWLRDWLSVQQPREPSLLAFCIASLAFIPGLKLLHDVKIAWPIFAATELVLSAATLLHRHRYLCPPRPGHRLSLVHRHQ